MLTNTSPEPLTVNNNYYRNNIPSPKLNVINEYPDSKPLKSKLKFDVNKNKNDIRSKYISLNETKFKLNAANKNNYINNKKQE
jgi:hypothetical protein